MQTSSYLGRRSLRTNPITLRYLEVILPLPLEGYFTYAIEDELFHSSIVGCRVIVPFGKRKIYTGVVAREIDSKPNFHNLKEVMDVLDEKPILNVHQIKFILWISEYYMCSVG